MLGHKVLSTSQPRPWSSVTNEGGDCGDRTRVGGPASGPLYNIIYKI